MALPSVKQLEAFWWAAQCANFATAAERIHLSISALSKRLAELESAIGQPLFDRSGQKAVLTDTGRRLLPVALQVLDAAAAFERQTADATALRGHCRFGVGDLSALTWLPALVALAHGTHPGLVLEPYVNVGGVLERRLADGELDFAVIAGLSPRSELVSQAMGQARFEWVAAPALTAAPRKRAAPGGAAKPGVQELLRRHPLVTLPADAGTTRLLDEWLLAHKAGVEQRIVCNSWAAVAGMIGAGVGVGFLPAGWAERLKLHCIGARSPLRPLQYAFQWRRGDSRGLLASMRAMVATTIDFTHAPCIGRA
ncbi:LysR family transcriptional regulator [Bordetella genomosp. 9]|uniref:LysR family transcriptional regulator n=1 Tax=Bordetella genomosp. 9 TaxID=1416803 RepID=A0A261RMY1_9BORD|nr:LysR family transcriptional regulator [Bordetella genomosp. 9]OZI25960.1 LysR family transcriptional regulator [Bordetella genomosp. 9]